MRSQGCKVAKLIRESLSRLVLVEGGLKTAPVRVARCSLLLKGFRWGRSLCVQIEANKLCRNLSPAAKREGRLEFKAPMMRKVRFSMRNYFSFR